MKRLILIVAAVIAASVAKAEKKDSLLVIFWNLENFFDYTDEGKGESDAEFSSSGKRKWTKTRFYRKCDMVAKSLLWMNEKYGRMPDVAGFAEIENKGVLRKMLNHTLLRKYDYDIVHYDSGDKRGIDVALLYRKSSFDKLSSSVVTPEYEGQKMSTRDILLVCLESTYCSKINFIVNHHPSKYGGEKQTRKRRDAAMNALNDICDSLFLTDPESRIVAMGDFNDDPSSPSFAAVEGLLSNKGSVLHESRQGTIRYAGKWELIDMFLTDRMTDCCSLMEICRIPFLMVWDNTHQGEKPLRTYNGPRYLGGVSDHCPIVLKICYL